MCSVTFMLFHPLGVVTIKWSFLHTDRIVSQIIILSNEESCIGTGYVEMEGKATIPTMCTRGAVMDSADIFMPVLPMHARAREPRVWS